MPRVPIYVEAKTDAGGDAVSGATVTVTKRVGGTNAQLWSAEIGGVTVANPIVTDSLGRALAWVERGDYNAAVAGTGITSYTLPIDSASGADYSVTPEWVTSSLYTGNLFSSTAKSRIEQAEATSSTTFTTLTTPDSVSITMPTDGIFIIFYKALWKTTVSGNERAGLFLGANQVTVPSGTGAPTAHSQAISSSADSTYNTLVSDYTKFQGLGVAGSDAQTIADGSGLMEIYNGGPPMTGSIGGPFTVFAAAGTYTVSVQFKNNAAGTLTVKSRKLHVYAMPFA